MLNLTPDLFSYKMFTAPKTKITEDDLCNALRMYQEFWTKKDLKLAIKKVGLTSSIRKRLATYSNPLSTHFSNTNDDAKYIVLRTSYLDYKYMTPQEYQKSLIIPATISNLFTIERATHYISKADLTMYLTILKRYPRTTQSRILIKYLKQILKDN